MSAVHILLIRYIFRYLFESEYQSGVQIEKIKNYIFDTENARVGNPSREMRRNRLQVSSDRFELS